MSEIFYSDDGEPLGNLHQADDGAFIVTDLDDAQVLAATAADGTPLDPDGYEIGDADDTGYGPNEQLAAEIAELRQDVAEYAQQQLGPVTPPRTWDQLGHDVARQAQGLEAQLGRALLPSERVAVGEVIEHHVAAGREPDTVSAYNQAVDEQRIKPLDLDSSHADRTAFMTARLNESNRVERGEDPHTTPPPSRDLYDLDNPQQRREWMSDRMEGRLGDDQADAVAYSSTDYAE